MPTPYHASALDVTGDGSEGAPFGINQLITAGGRTGTALDGMTTDGDTLLLDGDSGTFDFATEGTPNVSYLYGILSPRAHNCTIRSKPGTVAVCRRISGMSPIWGPQRRDGFLAQGTKVLGIEFREAQTPGKMPALMFLSGVATSTGTITHLTGTEIGYCRVRMNDITGQSYQTDNHDCIRGGYTDGCWVHHCELTESQGGSHNSAGVKMYQCYNDVWEDNYIHGNSCGFFLKSQPHGVVVRRNLIINNVMNNGTVKAIHGTGYVDSDGIEIYDNILDSDFQSDGYSSDYNIHNNLFLCHGTPHQTTPSLNPSTMLRHQIVNVTPPAIANNLRFHSNILLSATNAPRPIVTVNAVNYGTDPTLLLEFDYNLCVSAAGGAPVPTYTVAGSTLSLAAIRALGYENNSQFVSGGLAAIFDDVNNYVLKSAYLTAGKASGIVGPSQPATVMDTTRYGPEALVALEGGGTYVPPEPPSGGGSEAGGQAAGLLLLSGPNGYVALMVPAR